MGRITFITGLIALVVTLATDFGQDDRKAIQNNNADEALIRSTWTDRLMFVSLIDYIESGKDPLASIKKGELWRLITPAFIHMEPMHLLFNFLALLSLGSLCERLLGSGKYFLLMVAAHLLGAFAQALAPESLQGSVRFGGLSGVVYGTFGYLWFRPMIQNFMPPLLPPMTVALLLGWLAIGWLPIGIHMANWAHLGGLIAGILLAFVLPANWGRF